MKTNRTRKAEETAKNDAYKKFKIAFGKSAAKNAATGKNAAKNEVNGASAAKNAPYGAAADGVPDERTAQPAKKSLKHRSFYAAAVLVVVAVVSTAILAGVNLVTKVDATQQFFEKLAVFYPAATVEKNYDLSEYSNGSFTEIEFAVKLSDGVTAVLSKSKKAYSGDGLELLVFFKDGVICQIEKYRAAETPGIGSKVVSNEYLDRYVGHGAEEFYEKESNGGRVVDAVTGATKSSNGVNYAVTAAANYYLFEAKA